MSNFLAITALLSGRENLCRKPDEAISKGHGFILFVKDFIYLFMRERERQRHRQREKQDPCREPDVTFNPGCPGSHPRLKAVLNC